MTEATKQIIEMVQYLLNVGYSQTDIAKTLKIERATVSYWGTGKAKRLSHTYIPLLQKMVKQYERKHT